jgi:glycosyltransferase involved in cell wall biosynthesis
MPAYLAAADVGLSFIKRCFSKLASSPTKNAEYLACGLPIVINAGIGDSDRLAAESPTAVLLNDFNEQAFEKALSAIEQLVNEPDVKVMARAVAEKEFDVKTVGAERYARLYESVLRSS